MTAVHDAATETTRTVIDRTPNSTAGPHPRERRPARKRATPKANSPTELKAFCTTQETDRRARQSRWLHVRRHAQDRHSRTQSTTRS